jgi:hypothetical protein
MINKVTEQNELLPTDNKKFSGLGILSFIAGCVIWLMILSIVLGGPTSEDLNMFFFLSPLIGLAVIILGIAAVLQRIFVKRRLWWFGILGSSLAIGCAILVCVWIMGAATSWH